MFCFDGRKCVWSALADVNREKGNEKCTYPAV